MTDYKDGKIQVSANLMLEREDDDRDAWEAWNLQDSPAIASWADWVALSRRIVALEDRRQGPVQRRVLN